jgi:uncharacterized repeat protein (TIGR04076 family)
MFKVKATVIDMLGDIKKYPCHFGYRIGEEIIFTGAEFHGRICPGVLDILAPKVVALHAAGPRYAEPSYYFPFWYSPPSVRDPRMKKYDGIGFRNVLHTIADLDYGMSLLMPEDSGKWPPHPERTVGKGITAICGDTRTSVKFKLEAFDLAEDGSCMPYFRREMSVLNKVALKPGILVKKIFKEFTREEIETIYPALSPVLVEIFIQELADIGFLELENGRAFHTKKGKSKLADFKKSLTPEEKKALKY